VRAPPNRYQPVTKKVTKGLDNVGGCCHTRYINKTVAGSPPLTVRKQNMNAPLIGEAFTTQSSGVTGTVQEVIKNSTGSLRVRLDVNGQDRWTTVK